MLTTTEHQRKAGISDTKRRWPKILWTLVAAAVVIQFVPYGRNHDNPPVTAEPEWNSEQTRALFYRACGDCHSNRTRWPWYSAVAPVSWLVQSDVDEARSELNVSEGVRGGREGDHAAYMIRSGGMPLWYYLPLHPDARLNKEEKEQLALGLSATLGGKGAPQHEHGEHDDD